MKQDPAFMESMHTAARMQHVQQFNRESVLRLLSHIETTEANEQYWMAEYEKQSEHVRRLIDNVAQLQRELMDAKEGKKIVLSREVVAEIEAIQDQHKFAGPNTWMYKVLRGIFEESPSTFNIRRRTGVKPLLEAFIFGYTVEEPIDHEQRLRVDIHQLVTTWDRTRPTSSLVKDIDERLDDYFQEIAK